VTEVAPLSPPMIKVAYTEFVVPVNGSRAAPARGFMALLAMLAMGLGLMASPAGAAPFAYVTNFDKAGQAARPFHKPASPGLIVTKPLSPHPLIGGCLETHGVGSE
jgi:hypothetical protein